MFIMATFNCTTTHISNMFASILLIFNAIGCKVISSLKLCVRLQ